MSGEYYTRQRNDDKTALREKNAKLREELEAAKSTIVDKNREIRWLEKEHKILKGCRETDLSRIKHLTKLNEELTIKNNDFEALVVSLQKENEGLRAELNRAKEEVEELNGTNKKLEKQINTNCTNSSMPSSAQPIHQKVPNSRKPSGKKPGGQPGHEAHSASRLTPTVTPILIPAPDEYKNNPDYYPTGKMITKQVIDLHFFVSVRDYQTPEYRSKINGARVHAPFPAGVVNPVNYGPSLKTFIFLLNNFYNVSVAKTKQCVEDITQGVVSPSTGMICNLAEEFSVATEKDREQIFSRLHNSAVLYSDATGSNVNGNHKAVIVCTNNKEVLYLHLDSKGHKGLDKTPLKGFDGTVVHDHDRTFYSYGKNHQECLAHVLRYLVGATENEPKLTWHTKMHELLTKMIHITKEHREKGARIPRAALYDLTDEYEDILDTAAAEYKEHPPSKYYRDGFNLQKRLREYKKAHLFFLTHPEVDYTNNICERALRKFKRKLRQATVFRSEAGGQRLCAALSFIETGRMQNKNIFNLVQEVFAG